MVDISPNLYWLAFQISADSTEIAMKFFLIGRIYKWLATFCAEDEMYVVFYQ